jgi:hypothetical protein
VGRHHVWCTPARLRAQRTGSAVAVLSPGSLLLLRPADSRDERADTALTVPPGRVRSQPTLSPLLIYSVSIVPAVAAILVS